MNTDKGADLDAMKAKIDKMSRTEMAYIWRFASVGDPLLQGDVGDYFESRFRGLGGFSAQISKAIGWDK